LKRCGCVWRCVWRQKSLTALGRICPEVSNVNVAETPLLKLLRSTCPKIGLKAFQVHMEGTTHKNTHRLKEKMRQDGTMTAAGAVPQPPWCTIPGDCTSAPIDGPLRKIFLPYHYYQYIIWPFIPDRTPSYFAL
jgi:hypothetical protein